MIDRKKLCRKTEEWLKRRILGATVEIVMIQQYDGPTTLNGWPMLFFCNPDALIYIEPSPLEQDSPDPRARQLGNDVIEVTGQTDYDDLQEFGPESSVHFNPFGKYGFASYPFWPVLPPVDETVFSSKEEKEYWATKHLRYRKVEGIQVPRPDKHIYNLSDGYSLSCTKRGLVCEMKIHESSSALPYNKLEPYQEMCGMFVPQERDQVPAEYLYGSYKKPDNDFEGHAAKLSHFISGCEVMYVADEIGIIVIHATNGLRLHITEDDNGNHLEVSLSDTCLLPGQFVVPVTNRPIPSVKATSFKSYWEMSCWSTHHLKGKKINKISQPDKWLVEVNFNDGALLVIEQSDKYWNMQDDEDPEVTKDNIVMRIIES